MLLEAKMLFIISLLSISVMTDLHSYKVKNGVCLCFGLMGFIYNLSQKGFAGAYISFFGLITPFIILFPLYAFNMLGAGDIKLLCTVGAFIGVDQILLGIAYSFLFGLVHSVAIMITRRNYHDRLKKLCTYLKSCLLAMDILPYEKIDSKSSGRIHFTISIAVGILTVSLI